MFSETDTVKLELDPTNSITVHLHGATIISWIGSSKERLFVSKKSAFDNKKAIRGGIPIVFPQFGAWENGAKPQHGFARNKRWTVVTKNQNNESVSLKLSLNDDEETRQLWNFKFELNYDICLKKNALETAFSVINKDDHEFDFTCLLHTYFKTNSINEFVLNGLEGLIYIDKVDSNTEKVEENNEITICSEVDRIYKSAPESVILDIDHDRIMVIKENFPDLVVWNPWIEKSKKMVDFDDEEYKNMFCIEPGYVSERVSLMPGKSFHSKQELFIVLQERI